MIASQSWRDEILKQFTPQVSRLTLAADPDGLLLEEGVLAGIRERGFELIPFDDHVAFRFAYESKYRARWDQGEATDLVVVLRAGAQDLRLLPFDLLQAGRQLTFSLGELFPNLSYPVVEHLDRGDLDALYRAQTRFAPGPLGDNATKDFVLRHVFEMAPEVIRELSDLLRALLRRHYRNLRIPRILEERFIQILEREGCFAGWPLGDIVPSRWAFFAFLQERWPVFLETTVAQADNKVQEAKVSYGFRFTGPAELPFGHDDVRVYIDNLFLEGHLRPVDHHESKKLAKSWAAVGVRYDPQADRVRRFRGLLEVVEGSIPREEGRHSDWLALARRWAEVGALPHSEGPVFEPGLLDRMRRVQEQIEKRFTNWMIGRYPGLHNQPAMPPVMLHHLPRHLARRLTADRVAKVALVVVDGLSLEQWVTIREELALGPPPGFEMQEGAVLAWVPTLTSVSRQALFAGKVPLLFERTIYSTQREPDLWRQFWLEQGLLANQVGYLKGLGDGPLTQLEELATQPRTRTVGLVVDKIDRIMHGMELGATGMHNQVRQWAREGYLGDLLNLLLRNGFEVHITSDHGNIEATGIGRPTEGAAAEVRGERARVYPNDLLRRSVKEKFPQSIEWPTLGLPDDYRPLLASHREAFVNRGERIVGHGSIAIEEVVVPHVQIRMSHA